MDKGGVRKDGEGVIERRKKLLLYHILNIKCESSVYVLNITYLHSLSLAADKPRLNRYVPSKQSMKHTFIEHLRTLMAQPYSNVPDLDRSSTFFFFFFFTWNTSSTS